MIEIVTALDLEVPRGAVAWKPPHTLLIGTDAGTSQRNNDHDRPRQSRIRIACDVMITPDNIQRSLPPHSSFVPLTRLLEALDHLRVALAKAEVRIIGGSVLIIHEGNWVRAEKAAWKPEGVSVLNDKPTASDEFGLGWKAEVPLYEEDEDEDKITVELDAHGPLDGVVATSPVVECSEETMKTRLRRMTFPCSHSS